MINEGEKKKMQMPPTNAMRDKSESEPRKEGREEGRQRPSTPSTHTQTHTPLPRSLCTARQPSIITHLHTNSPAKHTQPHTKQPNNRETYAGYGVRRSNYNPSKVTPCNVSNNEKNHTLNVMDVSAGAPGRVFLMLFSKYKRQYEL